MKRRTELVDGPGPGVGTPGPVIEADDLRVWYSGPTAPVRAASYPFMWLIVC